MYKMTFLVRWGTINEHNYAFEPENKKFMKGLMKQIKKITCPDCGNHLVCDPVEGSWGNRDGRHRETRCFECLCCKPGEYRYGFNQIKYQWDMLKPLLEVMT